MNRDWWRVQVERGIDRDWWRAEVDSCGDRRVRRRGDGSGERRVGGLPKRGGHGSFFDAGRGGLPNPTESTMWGKGSSGACCYLSRDPQGKRGGATCWVLTSAYWFATAIPSSTDEIV
jgi:hypothetical protein